MQIVTDTGMDLSQEQSQGLMIHQIPLVIELDGHSYRSGVDISNQEFYELLASAKSLPQTSLPAPGDFAALYREVADQDREVLSVHISSGLSGTYAAARVGAGMVPEADISVFDTMTLSGAEGWQVEAAARAARAGWTKEHALKLLAHIRTVTETVFTLPDLTYLRHGGRIGHIKGLLATVLKIKPVIGVSKADGRYYQRAQYRTFPRALEGLIEVMTQDHSQGSALRIQMAHANNPEGAETLRELLSRAFKCEWLPSVDIAPVLGAHPGPGLVGVVYASTSAYPVLP